MIETLPNRHPEIVCKVSITTPYYAACPVSGEPRRGSVITVTYTPTDRIIGLDSIAKHLPTYATEAIDVETVAQLLARDCANAISGSVKVEARYLLRDGIEIQCNVLHSSTVLAKTSDLQI